MMLIVQASLTILTYDRNMFMAEATSFLENRIFQIPDFQHTLSWSWWSGPNVIKHFTSAIYGYP